MLKSIPAAAIAALLATPALVAPAHAQSTAGADRLVQELIAQQHLQGTDKVWLALPSGDRTTRDIAVCDAVSAALSARGIAVMWDVGLASSLTSGGYQEQIAALKAMGVNKLVSFGRVDDVGSLTLRVAEVPGGWIKAVRTVNLGPGGGPAAPAAVVVGGPTPLSGPTVVIPPDRLINWNPGHGLGLQYSSLAGSGATYRNWKGSWGWQVAGIPALAFTDGQASGFVNMGLQGMYTLLKTDNLRLHTLLGMGALYRPSETRSVYNPTTGISPSRTGEAWDLGLAPGIGLDYRIFDRFLVTGALGYTFSRQSFIDEEATFAYSPGFTIGTVIEW